MSQQKSSDIRSAVRENYARIAVSGKSGCGDSTTSCCGARSKSAAPDVALGLGYTDDEISAAPNGANMGLGCGNPQAIASLKAGESVLDLGSGGGFDCFLAAQAVGEQGQVIGVDMTPEMIEKSRANLAKTDFGNVEFRLGEIENLPVARESVDVIISNCVINLSPEKKRVFSEAFRVLKPGGRIAVSDIVATTEIPDDLKNNMSLYAGCAAGAATITELEAILRRIGFEKIKIQSRAGKQHLTPEWAPGNRIEDYVVSANIEDVKPAKI